MPAGPIDGGNLRFQCFMRVYRRPVRFPRDVTILLYVAIGCVRFKAMPGTSALDLGRTLAVRRRCSPFADHVEYHALVARLRARIERGPVSSQTLLWARADTVEKRWIDFES